MTAIEVLKKDLDNYAKLKATGSKCLTGNNEECCFVHYPEIKEALEALEQKENYASDIKQYKELVKCYETKVDILLNEQNESTKRFADEVLKRMKLKGWLEKEIALIRNNKKPSTLYGTKGQVERFRVLKEVEKVLGALK